MAQDNGTLRRCPLCEATLPEGHSKCLFCGSIVEPEPEKPTSVREGMPSELPVLTAYAVVGLGVLALWLGVWRLSPMLPRTLLFVTVVALTNLTVGALIARDAARVDVASRAYGVPWKWFLATLFLMPLTIILYSAVRARCGGEDRTRVVLALALVWLASALFVANSIQHKPTMPTSLQREWEDQLNRTLDSQEQAITPSPVTPAGQAQP